MADDKPRPFGDPDFCDSDRERWAAMAADESDQVIGDLAGVERMTVHRWRARFGVVKTGAIRGRDVASTDEKRDLAQTVQRRQTEIVEVLFERLHDDDPTVQVAAAKILLDRGWGKPYAGQPPELGGGEAAVNLLAMLEATLDVDSGAASVEPGP